MITRKMAEGLADKIVELENLIEQQSLQLERLQKASERATSGSQIAQNCFDVTKIPDVIKMVPGYSGNDYELPAWLDSVEKKLECAKKVVPADEIQLVMPIWESIIRDKITGKANEALLMSNTDCNWAAIKTKLKERFGDKRDLSTIVSNIPYLKQGTRGVEEFYFECDSLLSAINAKIMLDDTMKPCAKTIITTYETMLVNAYIDGLHEPISSLTRTSKPDTLLSAYRHALEQANAASRKKERNRFEIKSNAEPHRFIKPQIVPPRSGGWTPNARPSYSSGNHFNSQNARPHFPINRYTNNQGIHPPFTSNNNNYSNQQYPSGVHTMNYQSRQVNQNNQSLRNKQYPAIKQEPSSASNIRKFQNIHVHDEQPPFENNDLVYDDEPNSNNNSYQDQEAQEEYYESDDVNFQQASSKETET